jgi:hypothetical protein
VKAFALIALGLAIAAMGVYVANADDAPGAGRVNGELAGGMVMSLTSARDSGVVIAVTSKLAHANTSELARRVRDAFAEQAR